MKIELLAKIEEKAESQLAIIGSQVDQVRENLKRADEMAETDSLALRKRIASIEQGATDHSDSIAALRHNVTEMKNKWPGLKHVIKNWKLDHATVIYVLLVLGSNRKMGSTWSNTLLRCYRMHLAWKIHHC